jgi:release factor glutamine methyltransferase
LSSSERKALNTLPPHLRSKLGISLAVRIVEESLARLNPGGRLILYSGTPIIGGSDPFFEALGSVLKLKASDFSYGEIDPDDRQAYAKADRIAAIGLTATKRG